MIISRTPFRVSLFGGGTDFPDYYRKSKYGYGVVISTAVNRYTYFTVNNRFEEMIRVSYSQTEYVKSVDEVKHNIIREALRIVGITQGIDVVYMADIPLGSKGIGLASSSAMAVGVLNALYAYKGVNVSAEKLAKEACEIEIGRLNNPIGKQDQYAVAFGGLKRYQFNSDDTVFDSPVLCKKDTLMALQKHLMFFYTGDMRDSSGILTEQKSNINSKMSVLDQMVEIANEAEKLIQNNNIEPLGELLDDSWNLKRSLATNVSNQKVDWMYDAAKKAGAKGGKILGAGGGGFLMLFVDEENQEKVKHALHDYRSIDMQFEPQGSKIIYVG